MEQLISQFPKQIAEAIEIAKQSTYTFHQGKNFDNVLICGMGGSGIGGAMVTQLFEKTSKTPILLLQDYTPPAFVNQNTLVIGSSYSGTTEETLSAIKTAEEKGATIVGVSSGGNLIKICKEKGYDYVELPSGNPPRSMLAYSMIQLIKILSVANIIPESSISSLDNCQQLLEKEIKTIKEEATRLAHLFYKKQGIIYADKQQESIAIRARQQFNENSKQLVWHHTIPEMNHNELVGWGGGDSNFAVLFLRSQFSTERNGIRTNLCNEIIREKTPHIINIQGQGNSIIEEYFYFIHIVDWASIYLADMNGKDAVEVNVIDYLKSNLSKV